MKRIEVKEGERYGRLTIGYIGGYHYCLPYNDETAKLIGTTKDMEVSYGRIF